MTVIRIELSNNERLDFFLALLRRVAPSDEINIAIEQDGQARSFRPPPEAGARFDEMVDQFIEDALAGKFDPLTAAEDEREERSLMAYAAERLRVSGRCTDDEIARMINEDRSVRRETTVVSSCA
jgi:hypothetical protein